MGYLSPDSAAALAALASADAPLERLAAIRTAIAALEADPATLQAVRDARADGADWGTVAEAAGLGTAAAKWRWQGTDADAASGSARRPSIFGCPAASSAPRPSNSPTDAGTSGYSRTTDVRRVIHS